MSEHARLSPSNHRWTHCPGSVREEAKYPDIPGEAAIDGTGTHLLLERSIIEGVHPKKFLGEIIGVNHPDKPNGWLIREDRVDRVTLVHEYIQKRKHDLLCDFGDKYGKNIAITVESESKSNPGATYGRDDWWGTVDVTITVYVFKEVKFVEVIDLKDGRMRVKVGDNPQMIAYAIGKSTMMANTESVTMTIVQPRTSPPIRSTTMTVGQLYMAGLGLKEAAAKTDDINARLVPDMSNGSGYCQWCKHKKNCIALGAKKMKRLKDAIEIVTGETPFFETIHKLFGDIKTIPDASLTNLLDCKGILLDIIKMAQEEAEIRIESGKNLPGYAMLPGNSKRVWNESFTEEELVKILKKKKIKKEVIRPVGFISPAQAMKHIPKDELDEFQSTFISVKPGAKTLTAVSRFDRDEKSAVDIFGGIVGQCKTEEISFL